MTFRELFNSKEHMIPLIAGVIFYCSTHYMRLSSFMNKHGKFPSWTEYWEFQGGEDARALKWLRNFCYLLFLIFAATTWLKMSS
jgi:hypothetical protein